MTFQRESGEMKLKPEDVPELKYIKTIEHGVDLYAVDETYC